VQAGEVVEDGPAERLALNSAAGTVARCRGSPSPSSQDRTLPRRERSKRIAKGEGAVLMWLLVVILQASGWFQNLQAPLMPPGRAKSVKRTPDDALAQSSASDR